MRRDYEYVNGQRVRPRRSFFGRLLHGATILLTIVGAVSLLALLGIWKPFGSNSNKTSREAIIAEEEKFHGIVLTNENVMAQLSDISELMTYSETYAGTANVTDSLQIPYTDIDIWGTQHQIEIVYSGTIKIGYDLNEMKTVVNNQRKEIYISIPDDPIIDNNLPQENVTILQDNNLFNPIRADEVNVRLSEIKAQWLESSIANGICDKAKDHLKEIITESLVKMHSDYKVIFLDQGQKPAQVAQPATAA